MSLGEYFSNTADQISNLNQQWLFTNSGTITRIEYYTERLVINDSGLRIRTQGLGSSMVVSSRQRGGLGGIAAYGPYGSTGLLYNADGNTTDSSPNAFSTTVSGTAAYHFPKVGGSSFDFNGSGNFYLFAGNNTIINPTGGTFECWFNPRINASGGVREQTLIWAGELGGNVFGPQQELYLIIRSGLNRVQWGAVSGAVTLWSITAPPANVLTSGTWTHIAGTWAGSGQLAKLYHNGKIIGSALQADTFTNTSFIAPRIGCPHLLTGADGSRFAVGLMDEVRISTKERPVNEQNYLTTYLGSGVSGWQLAGPNGLVI